MSNSELNRDLRVRVSKAKRKAIEEIAMAQSEPGDQKSISDIVREAVDDYLEDYDENQ